ncbi:MAG: nicotinate-nucleotide diphosphorylase, partial [Candidatus Adiutrix sp.]
MSPFSIFDIVRLALIEDLGPYDLTSKLTIPPDLKGRAVFLAKSDLTVSGLAPAAETVRQVDPKLVFTPLVADGSTVPFGTEIAVVEGAATSILSAERVALNFLMRLSGV